MYTRKKIEKNLKKTKKSVDKKGSPWYYIQALERDGKKPKAKSLKGKPLEREHRTLKIKQREKDMEPVISLRDSKKLTRNRTQQICDERQNDVMSELKL